MRIRVDQAIVSGNDLKIVANRRRKIYKTSAAVKRRDVRISLVLFLASVYVGVPGGQKLSVFVQCRRVPKYTVI